MKGYAPPEAAEINRRFGEMLRDQRKRADMTQGELAKAIGLERTSVTNIEAGLQAINIGTLVRICEVLGITPAQIVPFDASPIKDPLSSMRGQYAHLAREILRDRTDAAQTK